MLHDRQIIQHKQNEGLTLHRLVGGRPGVFDLIFTIRRASPRNPHTASCMQLETNGNEMKGSLTLHVYGVKRCQNK